MAAAFFAKHHPKQVVQTESDTPVLVRTMRDDLEDIKNGKQNARQTEKVGGSTPQYAFKNASSQGKAVNPFSEAGEGGGDTEGNNPFGVSQKARQIPSKNQSPRPVLDNGLSPMVPEGGLIINEPKKASNKALIVIIVTIFILIMLAFGALWYFTAGDWKKALNIVYPPAPVEEVSTELPEPPVPQSLPYSLDTPNYLSIDTEVVSLEDIQKTFSQTASRIKEAHITSPVEFLMTDKNNNPLAFSRVAFLLGIDMDPELLALIDESFSLYVYDDAGNMRLGLALGVMDSPAVAPILVKTEKTLPHAFRALILESNITIPESLIFQSSTHDRFSIRYTNIDSAHNISLDYAMDGNFWYIGTSKNTLRAILEKHIQGTMPRVQTENEAVESQK